MLKIFYFFFFFTISLLIIVFIVSISVLWKYGNDLPDYRQLQSYQTKALTRVYSSNENILTEFASEKRIYVPYQAIPDLVIKSFVVAEDKNFFKHDGLDFQGILRAMIHNVFNIFSGSRLVGASTITQQVAKNFLLTNEVSFDRKIKEALLALRIERTLSKEKILELYLNEIFLGFRSYGIVVASKNYFDKSLDELSLSEIAFLAGLPKGPNNYHPIKKPNAALNRRNYVLRRLFEEGIIHKRDYKDSIRNEINVINFKSKLNFKAKYFSEEVRRILIKRYGEDVLYNSGFYIFTTLDEDLQKYAEDAVKIGLQEYDRRQGWRGVVNKVDLNDFNVWQDKISNNIMLDNKVFPALITNFNKGNIHLNLSNGIQGLLDIEKSSWIISNTDKNDVKKHLSNILTVGDVILVTAVNNNKEKESKNNEYYEIYQKPEVNGALVAIDSHTGKVLALVGGSSYLESKFNRATQAKRQAGSAFKPFVYLAALEQGLVPSSLILDSPLVIDQGPGLEEWIPKNYSGNYYGLSTLRTGLEKSRNVMTVRLANTIGIDKVVEIADRFNIGDYPKQLATALGAGETSLINLTTAYASFVNGGKLLKPEFIETIHNRHGEAIFKRDDSLCKACLDKEVNHEIFNQNKNFPRVVSEENAFQIYWLLNGVIQNGTGKSVKNISEFIGGKTGTTNDNKDAWFIGFSSDLIVGVYVGYDTPKSLGKKETGGKVSAPIWGKFMEKALLKYKSNPISIPENIDMVKIDADTGFLPNHASKNVYFEAFISGTAPTEKYNKPQSSEDKDILDGQIY